VGAAGDVNCLRATNSVRHRSQSGRKHGDEVEVQRKNARKRAGQFRFSQDAGRRTIDGFRFAV
jgi:hypothetical protein